MFSDARIMNEKFNSSSSIKTYKTYNIRKIMIIQNIKGTNTRQWFKNSYIFPFKLLYRSLIWTRYLSDYNLLHSSAHSIVIIPTAVHDHASTLSTMITG